MTPIKPGSTTPCGRGDKRRAASQIRSVLDLLARSSPAGDQPVLRSLLTNALYRITFGESGQNSRVATSELELALRAIPWQRWDMLVSAFITRFEGIPCRRRLGLYFTEQPLARALAEAVLTPWHRSVDRPDSQPPLLDPACGVGNLLIAALDVLVALGRPAAEIVPHLFGVEIDPMVAEIARLRLALAARGHGIDDVSWHDRIVCADALTLGLPDGPRGMARVETWAQLFPQVFPPQGVRGFAVILGNPPFANAIETTRNAWKPNGPERFPELGGTADRAYHFLALSRRLARADGRIALIQPQPVLGSPAMRKFWESDHGLRLNGIIRLEHSRPFDQALVFACGIVLGPEASIRTGSIAKDGTLHWERLGPSKFEAWANGPFRGSESPTERSTVGNHFEVTAGLTTAEAYDLRSWLADDPELPGPKLLTTGLIDPRLALWGKRRCRFLGGNYWHPRIPFTPESPPWLKRRIVRAGRPKVLVAGLSKRIEAVLDADGEYAGSVGTFCITHPTDDVAALENLLDRLLSAEAQDHFWRELNVGRVGGGDLVMKKAFLEAFPLPLWPRRNGLDPSQGRSTPTNQLNHRAA